MRKAVRGFSLLELMIVVAVIGILAAIAMPSYSSYVRRANRVVAKTALVQIVSRQESFFADRKTYATALGPTGLNYFTADTFYIGKNGTPTTSTSGALYAIALENASATAFTVSATAYSADQKKDKESSTGDCHKLSIDNLGNKTAKKADNSAGSTACWTR